MVFPPTGFWGLRIPGNKPSPGFDENRGILSFQSLFQSCSIQRCEPHPGETVFGSQHKGLWQIIAGDYLAILLAPFQKFPGSSGSGGVVQVKDSYDGMIPDCHIIADGKIHGYTPLIFFHSATASSSQRLFLGLVAWPFTQW